MALLTHPAASYFDSVGPGSSTERFYVTGSSGALGARVVKQLLDAGAEVVADSDDDRRMRLIVGSEQLSEVRRGEALEEAMAGITHVICTNTLTEHGCLEAPAESAATAIGGFVDTIRAAVEAGVAGMAYESSMSVFAPSTGPVSEETEPSPVSLCGSYLLVQEILARRYFCEFGLASVGLRTNLVYGPGQDSAFDGGASNAIAAAIDDRWSQLDFWGDADFQFVGDVANSLVSAARDSAGRCGVQNLRGDRSSMAEFARAVARSTGVDRVSPGSVEYPLPPVRDEGAGALETSLDAGIRATAETLRWAPRDLCSWN